MFAVPEPCSFSTLPSQPRVQIGDRATGHHDGTGPLFRCSSGVGGDSGQADRDSLAAGGADGDFFDGTAVKVEARSTSPISSTSRCRAPSRPISSCTKKAMAAGGYRSSPLAKSFDGGREDRTATAAVIRTQARRGAAANNAIFDDRLAADADRHRVHVSRQQCAGATAIARQCDNQISAIAIESWSACPLRRTERCSNPVPPLTADQ